MWAALTDKFNIELVSELEHLPGFTTGIPVEFHCTKAMICGNKYELFCTLLHFPLLSPLRVLYVQDGAFIPLLSSALADNFCFHCGK